MVIVFLLIGLLGTVDGLVARSLHSVTAGSSSWEDPVQISDSQSDEAFRADVTIGSSGQIVVGWTDTNTTSGKRRVYTRVHDGNSWGDSYNEFDTETNYDSEQVNLLSVDSQHFVAWVEPTTSYAYEAKVENPDGIRAIKCPETLGYSKPGFVASGSELHVVFNGGSGFQPSSIYYSHRPFDDNWPDAKAIYTGAWSVPNLDLAMGQQDGNLHLVWQEKLDKDANPIIRYVEGDLSGAEVSWTDPITLSDETVAATRPAISADADGNLHVFWGEGERGRVQDVRYRRRRGSSWEAQQTIGSVLVHTQSPSYLEPDTALWESGKEAKICVSWQGYQAGESGGEEIWVSCSSDRGDTWTSPVNVSRTTNVFSIFSSITFDRSGLLHAVWQEAVDTEKKYEYEITYSRSLAQVFLPLVVRNAS
jgi:hypothetical protein